MSSHERESVLSSHQKESVLSNHQKASDADLGSWHCRSRSEHKYPLLRGLNLSHKTKASNARDGHSKLLQLVYTMSRMCRDAAERHACHQSLSSNISLLHSRTSMRSANAAALSSMSTGRPPKCALESEYDASPDMALSLPGVCHRLQRWLFQTQCWGRQLWNPWTSQL